LRLESGHSDKVEDTHCGVTRPGFLAVGGDVGYLSPGQAIIFTAHQVVVCRDEANQHHFVKLDADVF